MGYYYAVANGRTCGIYETWDECKAQVHGFSGAKYKKFNSKQDAQNFINNYAGGASSSSSNEGKNKFGNSSKRSYQEKKDADRSGDDDDFDDDDNEPPPPKKYCSSSYQRLNPNDELTDIYTDGACLNNGKTSASAGIGVYFGPNSRLNVSKPISGRNTNNYAEIMAVIEAAKVAKANKIKNIRINTDSQFLLKCFTQWITKWKKNGWKTANGENVRNREELIEMTNALSHLNVVFRYVKAHAGIPGNEAADKLARSAAQKYLRV